MSDDADMVLVSRLRKHADPFYVLGWPGNPPTLVEIKRQKPSRFRAIARRSFATRTRYDYGRIAYFVQQLEQGCEIEPIMVDCFCDGGRIYPEAVILDGCHRFCAHVLLRKRRIPIFFGGRVDLLEWLRGERRECPME